MFNILIPITEADITVRGSTDLLLSLSDLGFTGPFDKSNVAINWTIPISSVCSKTNNILSDILFLTYTGFEQ